MYSLNKVISISGSSGVGKTTLSEFLFYILGEENITVIRGDDSHKWEREDSQWEKYTHLNPEANNLESEVESILALKKGNSIARKSYNHSTGKFDNDVKILPNDFIIYEGLHALYGDMRLISDIGIFIETEESLKNQWKLNRDTQKRGYTKEQVEDVLLRREKDERLYIIPQRENADIVVTFEEKKDKAVHLEYRCMEETENELMKKVKKVYDMHRDFLSLCKKISFEYDLIQHGGGNISYKFDDKIIITSSGREMGEISMLDGFSLCNREGLQIKKSKDRPSMEVGLHLKISHPVVLHTHPIYLNTILCSEESEDILSEILSEYDYNYIPYVTPGKELKDKFSPNNENKISVLENHGLICGGNSFVEVFNISLHINKMCKKWLIKNSKVFKTFSHSHLEEKGKFLFPDAVVLEDKMKPINQYMIYIQRDIGLTPRFLPDGEVKKLLNMEEEKYRKTLL